MKNLLSVMIMVIIVSTTENIFAQNAVFSEGHAKAITANRNTLNEFIIRYNALKMDVDELKRQSPRQLGGRDTLNSVYYSATTGAPPALHMLVCAPPVSNYSPAPPAPVSGWQKQAIADDPITIALQEHENRIKKLEDSDGKQDERLDSLETWKGKTDDRLEALEAKSDEKDDAIAETLGDIHRRFQLIEQKFSSSVTAPPNTNRVRATASRRR